MGIDEPLPLRERRSEARACFIRRSLKEGNIVMCCRSTLLHVCFLSIVFFASGAVADPVLYATNLRFGTQPSLYILDPTNQSATLVALFDDDTPMGGLDYEASTGTLFGTTTGTNNLYTIDTQTGETTLIGHLGINLFMHAVAVHPATGRLYGISLLPPGPVSGLFEIDRVTGAATKIGTIPFAFVLGLAFHPATHVLYAVGFTGDDSVLLRLDLNTAQLIDVKPTRKLHGLSFHPDTFVLYGIDRGSHGTPDSLFTIDLSTGDTTLVGATGLENNMGLAFVFTPREKPIPAVTHWGMLVMALLLLTGIKVRFSGHLPQSDPTAA